MRTSCILFGCAGIAFVVLQCGCKGLFGETGYGPAYGPAVLIGTATDDINQGVEYATKKHVYAAAGTTYPEFEQAVAKAEQLPFLSSGAILAPSQNALDRTWVFKYVGRREIYYGRFVQMENSRAEEFIMFSRGELTNVASFAAQIEAASDPVSAYLNSRLSEQARTAIAALPGAGREEESLGSVLVEELNAMVMGPPIYDEERFRGVSLRPSTRRLLNLRPKPAAELPLNSRQLKARLNRMLLEDAYPQNLPMKPGRRLQDYVAVKY